MRGGNYKYEVCVGGVRRKSVWIGQWRRRRRKEGGGVKEKQLRGGSGRGMRLQPRLCLVMVRHPSRSHLHLENVLIELSNLVSSSSEKKY